MADREGFEPSVRFRRTHDFQSCAFDHSAIYPRCYLFSFFYFILQELFFICVIKKSTQRVPIYGGEFYLVV